MQGVSEVLKVLQVRSHWSWTPISFCSSISPVGKCIFFKCISLDLYNVEQSLQNLWACLRFLQSLDADQALGGGGIWGIWNNILFLTVIFTIFGKERWYYFSAFKTKASSIHQIMKYLIPLPHIPSDPTAVLPAFAPSVSWNMRNRKEWAIKNYFISIGRIFCTGSVRMQAYVQWR